MTKMAESSITGNLWLIASLFYDDNWLVKILMVVVGIAIIVSTSAAKEASK